CRVTARAQAAAVFQRPRQRVSNQVGDTMASTFVDGDLQGVVTAVAHALVKPLLEHVGVWPPGLNSAGSRRGEINFRSPVQMPADGTDIVRIEHGITR